VRVCRGEFVSTVFQCRRPVEPGRDHQGIEDFSEIPLEISASLGLGIGHDHHQFAGHQRIDDPSSYLAFAPGLVTRVPPGAGCRTNRRCRSVSFRVHSPARESDDWNHVQKDKSTHSFPAARVRPSFPKPPGVVKCDAGESAPLLLPVLRPGRA